MQIRSLIPALSIAALCSAAKLTVSIPPSPPVLPNPALLPASTHATLLGSPGVKYSAPLRRDNTFIFVSLPEDSYLLTIHTHDYFFTPYRVDVGHTETNAEQEVVHVWQTFRGNEWNNKGPVIGSGKSELRIDVRPGAAKDFYLQRGGFNVLDFLKSPMILMGLVSVVMIFGMPYLMENSEALIARALRLILPQNSTDNSQWTQRLRQSSTRCRQRVRSMAQMELRTRYRTLILLDSSLASRRHLHLLVARRRRSRLISPYKRMHSPRHLPLSTPVHEVSCACMPPRHKYLSTRDSWKTGMQSAQCTVCLFLWQHDSFELPSLHFSIRRYVRSFRFLLLCLPVLLPRLHY
jgi:hypothetical protein